MQSEQLSLDFEYANHPYTQEAFHSLHEALGRSCNITKHLANQLNPEVIPKLLAFAAYKTGLSEVSVANNAAFSPDWRQQAAQRIESDCMTTGNVSDADLFVWLAWRYRNKIAQFPKDYHEGSPAYMASLEGTTEIMLNIFKTADRSSQYTTVNGFFADITGEINRYHRSHEYEALGHDLVLPVASAESVLLYETLKQAQAERALERLVIAAVQSAQPRSLLPANAPMHPKGKAILCSLGYEADSLSGLRQDDGIHLLAGLLETYAKTELKDTCKPDDEKYKTVERQAAAILLIAMGYRVSAVGALLHLPPSSKGLGMDAFEVSITASSQSLPEVPSREAAQLLDLPVLLDQASWARCLSVFEAIPSVLTNKQLDTIGKLFELSSLESEQLQASDLPNFAAALIHAYTFARTNYSVYGLNPESVIDAEQFAKYVSGMTNSRIATIYGTSVRTVDARIRRCKGAVMELSLETRRELYAWAIQQRGRPAIVSHERAIVNSVAGLAPSTVTLEEPATPTVVYPSRADYAAVATAFGALRSQLAGRLLMGLYDVTATAIANESNIPPESKHPHTNPYLREYLYTAMPLPSHGKDLLLAARKDLVSLLESARQQGLDEQIQSHGEALAVYIALIGDPLCKVAPTRHSDLQHQMYKYRAAPLSVYIAEAIAFLDELAENTAEA